MPTPAKVDLEFDATKSLNRIERQLRAFANRPITLNIKTNNIGGLGGNSGGGGGGGGGGRSGGRSSGGGPSAFSLGRVNRDLNEFNKSLEASNARVLAFGASAGAIFAVTAAFKSLLGVTIEVDKALVGLNTILNLNDKSLASFSDSLFNIAKSTGQGFDAISEGAAELARQGLGAADTLDRLNDAAILSRLSGLSLAESVNSVTTALNSFDKAGLSSADVISKIVAVDQAFAVSSKDLADGLQRVGSSAQDAGVSFDQLLALLTTARQITGRTGSVIGNSFKTIFTRLQRGNVADALADVGVSDTNSNGGLKTQIELLTDLAKVYDTLTPRVKANIAEQVGGVFQINVLKATLGDLGKEYGIYQAALEKSSTASDQAIKKNEALNKSFSAQFNALTQSITQFSAKAGKDLFGGSFSNILGAGSGVFDALNESFSKVEQGGADIGQKFAVGFVKGVGNFIGGPALIGIAVIVAKIFFKLAKDSSNAFLTLLNPALTQTNKLLTQQAQILTQIGATQKGIGGLGGSGAGGPSKKGFNNNLGKFAGGGAIAGLGLNIAGGLAGDGQTGSLLNAGGNILGLGATGAAVGGPIGGVVGVFAGLVLSAKDLIEAFSEVEQAAKKSANDATKFSTDVASPIQDLTSRLLQNQSLVTSLSGSTNPADAEALIKAQNEQISLLDQLNEITGNFNKTFDSTNINVSDFGKLLEQISNKGTGKNLTASFNDFKKGGFNPTDSADLAKQFFDSIRGNLIKNPQLLEKIAGGSNFSGMNDVLGSAGGDVELLSKLSAESVSAFENFNGTIIIEAQELQKLTKDRVNAENLISENAKKEAEQRKISFANLKVYNTNLIKISRELIDVQARIFGNARLKSQGDSFIGDLSSNGNSGLVKILQTLGQTTSTNSLQNKNAQTGIKNSFSAQGSNDLLGRNEDISNIFKSVLQDIGNKNFANANKEGGDSVESNQLLNRLNLSSSEILRFISELRGGDNQDSVSSAIDQVGILLKAEKVDDKEIKETLKSLRDLTDQKFSEFIQGQRQLLQKTGNDLLAQGLQTALDQLSSVLDKQLNLFGGFKTFLDPSINSGRLQGIQSAVLANQTSNTPQRVGINNGGSSTQLPINQTEASRTFAALVDKVNEFFGRKIGDNDSGINKAIEDSKKTDFDNLIKTIIGPKASQNYFNSTRPSDFKGNLGDFATDAPPEIRKLVNNVQSAFQSDLKNGKLGENVQAEALTDSTFVTTIESQTKQLVDAYKQAAQEFAAAVATGTVAQPITINATINGVTNSEEVAKALQDMIEANNVKVKDAMKTNNPSKLNSAPSRGTINGVPSSQANSNPLPSSL